MGRSQACSSSAASALLLKTVSRRSPNIMTTHAGLAQMEGWAGSVVQAREGLRRQVQVQCYAAIVNITTKYVTLSTCDCGTIEGRNFARIEFTVTLSYTIAGTLSLGSDDGS